MKTKFLIVLLVFAILLQGCIVKSLHPFYKISDLTFKPTLLASWVDEHGDKWVIKRVDGKTKSYEMHWLGKGDKDVVFLGHIFQLNQELYLDFTPLDDNTAPEGLAMFNLHLLPIHSVGKIEFPSKDEINIKWFNGKWLMDLFDQKRVKISHEVITNELMDSQNDEYVLTASTDELQKFLIKYGNEKAAFEDENTVWLRLKRIDQ